MKSFVFQLICIMVLLAAVFFLIAKINQEKFKTMDGNLVAQYSTKVKLLVMLSYGIISILPLAISESLKEGNPFADRISFTIIHLFFLLIFMSIFNRRVVVGKYAVGLSNIFGSVNIIPFEKLVGASLSRSTMFVTATRFTLGNTRICIDDHMQNCNEIVAILRKKVEKST